MDSIPSAAPAVRDLSDDEFAELDELLAATPEPLMPCDAVMLDGYLCGVLVQPELIAPEAWLVHAFDFESRPLPDDVDPAWLERTKTLILRRHAALNAALAEHGWFDPLVLEPEEDDVVARDAAREASVPTDPITRALLPWVAGFQHATVCFPALAESADEAAMSALARLLRHLPAETAEERELVATLDREYPLASLDEAIEDMVAAVADLWDLTSEQRYRVETVRRAGPKVGRNDPCPCGSGRKFKHCHGA